MHTILGILPGESYSGIRALADPFCMRLKYTNRLPSGHPPPRGGGPDALAGGRCRGGLGICAPEGHLRGPSLDRNKVTVETGAFHSSYKKEVDQTTCVRW